MPLVYPIFDNFATDYEYIHFRLISSKLLTLYPCTVWLGNLLEQLGLRCRADQSIVVCVVCPGIWENVTVLMRSGEILGHVTYIKVYSSWQFGGSVTHQIKN